MANSNFSENPGGISLLLLPKRVCATKQEVGFKVSPVSLKQGQLIHYLASLTRWIFGPDAF